MVWTLLVLINLQFVIPEHVILATSWRRPNCASLREREFQTLSKHSEIYVGQAPNGPNLLIYRDWANVSLAQKIIDTSTRFALVLRVNYFLFLGILFLGIVSCATSANPTRYTGVSFPPPSWATTSTSSRAKEFFPLYSTTVLRHICSPLHHRDLHKPTYEDIWL